MQVFITGASGFLGSHLVKRLNDFTAIPHEKISTIKLKPFEKFYFLSTYGNMIDHQDIEKIIRGNNLPFKTHEEKTSTGTFRSYVVET